ncbi:ABC transporter substrate-binding protein [Cohnella sp. 56]|uniref:ABC transporter substrate-binding protein n=1 Tax=Cohnella sp. 56 TaxID=3113722 RepID=UPI0030EA341F
MRKKGWLASFCLFLAFASVASGCAKSSDNTPASSESSPAQSASASETNSTPAEKDVDLKIINFRVEDKAFYDQINQAFQEKYPHIHVKYDVVATKDYQQLKTARTAADDVDLIASGGESELADPNHRDLLADMNGQPFLEHYIPDALTAGQYEGKQLFLPTSSTTLVTFYNKKVFNDLGLQVPTTWDDFVKVLEQIKAAGIDPIMFGGKDQWPVNMILDELEAGIVRSQDKDFYLKMRTEETKFDPAWVEVYQKLGVLGKFFIKNAVGLDYGQAPGLFAQGKAAIMIDGSWSLAQIEDAKPEFEVGAFLLPGSNDPAANGIATTKFGFGWTVYKNSKNKDAAMKYLEFLSETENYKKYNDMVRMLPTQKDIQNASPIAQEISVLLAKQMPIWENLIIPGAKYNYTQYGMEVILGSLTPEEAAKKMQADLIGSKDSWK